MKKHDSIYGTTCWVCGHAGTRTRKFDELIYRVCDDCKLVKGSVEEIRAAREADVDNLVGRYDYGPHYWKEAGFGYMQALYASTPAYILDELRCRPYADDFAAGTKARLEAGKKAYHKAYKEKHK